MEQRNSAVTGQNLPELELKDLKPGRELTSKARCLTVLEVFGDGFVLAPALSVISMEDPRLGQKGEQGLALTLPLASWLSPGKFPGLRVSVYPSNNENTWNNMYEILHTLARGKCPVIMVCWWVDVFREAHDPSVLVFMLFWDPLPLSVFGNRGLLLTNTMWPL